MKAPMMAVPRVSTPASAMRMPGPTTSARAPVTTMTGSQLRLSRAIRAPKTLARSGAGVASWAIVRFGTRNMTVVTPTSMNSTTTAENEGD